MCNAYFLASTPVGAIKKQAREEQISRSALVRMIIKEYLARVGEGNK